MKEIASSEKLQGQLIGLNVLIEALLQTLSKQQLRQLHNVFSTIAPEVKNTLLNTGISDAGLEAFQEDLNQRDQLLRRQLLQAIQREAAQTQHPD